MHSQTDETRNTSLNNDDPQFHQTSPSEDDNPIAIVGTAIRLPGGVRSTDDFWDMLISKRDGRCEVPGTRYNVQAFLDSVRTKHGYFLQEDPAYFDAPFFSIPPVQAEQMDPQQRLLLEVVWECLENAGETAWQGEKIGCYVGVFGEDWLELESKDSQKVDRYRALGTGAFALANYLSYQNDFRGPSMTIQTGCSSSLVALHEACQALRSGHCTSAIVAGVNLILSPTMTTTMFDNLVLSPSGMSRTFDAIADGYGRGEAVNSIYIKPLREALQSNDPIRAIIRSTATNCDGRTPNITYPCVESQEALIRSAYSHAGISSNEMRKTGLFECHGTGTTVGDMVETSAVAKVFGDSGVVLGAVKPNVGHSEGASGLTSIIKAVLCLERSTILPVTHFNAPNPNIPFKEARLRVPVESIPWPPDRYKRVSVNSFGIGGSNAHAIIDSAAAYRRPQELTQQNDAQLLVISAQSAESLQLRVQQLVEYENNHPDRGQDLSYTLGIKREHLLHRAFTILQPNEHLVASSFEMFRSQSPNPIIFVFTGQGAQWPGMGKALMETFECFKEAVDGMDRALQTLDYPPQWSLSEEMIRSGSTSKVNDAEFAQPLCTALQIGIVEILAHWGIRASSVVGHSSGEIAAAYAAQAIDAPSAIILAYLRDHMQNVGPIYGSSVAQYIQHTARMVPLFSSVTDNIITDPTTLDAVYWRQNLERPVLFTNAINRALQHGSGRTFLEIGPHSALAGPLREIFRRTTMKPLPKYVPTLTRHDNDCRPRLLSTAGQIYALGCSVDLSKVIWKGTTLTDLPLYPWKHDVRFWNESRLRKDWRLRSAPHHELLGSRVVESTDREPSWRNVLRLENVPWLNDHVFHGDILFPGAGYIVMAGEAVGQMHPDLDSGGYSIKNLLFKAPLSLREGKIAEIITSLRPLHIADSVHSGWYAFTIASYDGKEWIQHCEGQVLAGCEQYPEPRVIRPFVRSVPREKWFKALYRTGLDCGPRFRGIKDITADPVENLAAATLTDSRESHGSNYYEIHPTTIDQCLQLAGVAACSGITRRLTKIYVPAAIDSIFVRSGGDYMAVEARAHKGLRDGYRGDAVAMLGEQAVLSLKGCYMFPLDDVSDPQRSVRLATRMKWAPDLDLLPPKEWLLEPDDSPDHYDMVKAGAQFCFLYILDTADRLRDVETNIPHLMKWKRWIMTEASKIRVGKQPLCKDPVRCAQLSFTEREKFREQLICQHDQHDSPVPRCIRQVFDNSLDFMSGKIPPIEALMEDRLLERYYMSKQHQFNFARFLELRCHSNPAQRILEIGAGTGVTTAAVLRDLKSMEGVRQYSQYVFTDITPGFLPAAKEKFTQEDSLEYRVLDISKDPLEQGFNAHSFDLIIASNVLHATPSLQATLKNVRALLARNGHLLLHELDSEVPVTSYIMGVLPGWWLGENDGRADKPYISPEKWDHELRAAGFTGAEVVARDAQPPYQTNATIISAIPQESPVKKSVTFLTLTLDADNWIHAAEEEFGRNGYTVERTTLQQNPRENQSIISFLDLQRSYLDHMSEEAFRNLQRYIEQAQELPLLWVTKASQLTCDDPRFGYIRGFARTLGHELSLDMSIFEIDTLDTTGVQALLKVYEKIQRNREMDHLDPEYEFALHDGIVYVGRHHWTTLHEELSTPSTASSRKLDIASYGLLDTLQWISVEEEPPSPGQVEVEVQFVGLNFRDMMVAMGLVGSKDEFGLEGSGVVRRTGPGVTRLQPGDRVALMHCGLFASNVIASEEECLELPDPLSLEDAATMLSVYITAIYSIIHVAALKEGQTILIHSACGGVGLASIRICQNIGAEIYATVGTEEKVRYLMETFGLPRNHIFHSRDTSFHSDLMRETNGRGVDIVLNSLAGKLLHASWDCVAPFGRMIELGKRDFLTHGKLSMSPFIANRAFFGVDLLQISQESPLILKSIMTTFTDWYQQGKIGPIRPVKVFEASNVVEAFRYMQTGTHMGKIVVQMPSNSAQLSVSPTPAPVTFHSYASYLLVGGLGGIGRAISTWMVDQGARELVYLSRSAGASHDDQAFIRELEVQGCRVTCVQGDVAKRDDVDRALGACTLPLAGVLQMALTLQDRTFLLMTYEEWTAGIASKVDGSWNLHQAVKAMDLDFFVLFGSIVGTCGHTSQANYAAANTYLESLMRYRRQLGLPASILNLGVVEETGMVSRDSKVLKNAQLASMHLLQEKDVVEGLKVAIRDSQQSPSHEASTHGAGILAIGLGHSDAPSGKTAKYHMWRRDARFTLYENLESINASTETQADDSELRGLLHSIEQDPSKLDDKETKALLVNKLCRILAQRLYPGQDMEDEHISHIAVDSLMTIEIRNWARRVLQIEISLTEISKAGTIGSLASQAIDSLKLKYTKAAASDEV